MRNVKFAKAFSTAKNYFMLTLEECSAQSSTEQAFLEQIESQCEQSISLNY